MIGSVTKTFTALTVMSLRDEGLLSLDDTLETYLPGTRHARVPLRQMLAHASGLQREPVGNIWETLVAPEREEFLAGVEDAEQVLPAHHAFHYSNLAYGLARSGRRARDGPGLGARRPRARPRPARDDAHRGDSRRRPRRGLPGRPLRRDREGGAALQPRRDGSARRAVVDGRRHGALRRLRRTAR